MERFINGTCSGQQVMPGKWKRDQGKDQSQYQSSQKKSTNPDEMRKFRKKKAINQQKGEKIKR
jgi:hypothetical protein